MDQLENRLGEEVRPYRQHSDHVNSQNWWTEKESEFWKKLRDRYVKA